MNKWGSIALIICVFLAFLFFQVQKKSDFQVLEVTSPTQIVVDLNKNGIQDENEIINLKDIKSFATKPSKEQSVFAQKLKISNEDALALGFLAQNFAKETLEGKKVKLNKKFQIIIDNKNYENLIVGKGLAVKTGEPANALFFQTLQKVRKLNLVIFNNKSHKYHKLNCKYGLMAHNSQIIPLLQLPQDAKPCKFCLGKHNKFLKYKKFKYRYNSKYHFYDDIIVDVKSPKIFYQTDSIKIFLTDFTRTLKPSNTCQTTICKVLVQEVNSAQNSIDFAIYGYTKIPQLQNALQNAVKRGVKVRFVYDSNKKKTNIYPDTNYLASILQNNNFDKTNAIMHDKFFIFDGQKVFTGSANISSTDMSGFNSNAILLIDSQQVANLYEQEFEQMYSGKFHKRKHRIYDKNVQLGSSELHIYFSPKDSAIENDIIPLIYKAKKYIYIPAFLLTDKELTQGLIDASKRGVNVRLILDATNTHSTASKLKLLRQNGIQVKTENIAGKLHSKSIIIDDTYTIIGSMNFSKSGENENDENLIIIKNPQIAEFYKTFFFYLWKRIPDKWLKYNARAESPDSIGSCSDGIDNDFDGKIDKADNSCKPIKYRK